MRILINYNFKMPTQFQTKLHCAEQSAFKPKEEEIISNTSVADNYETDPHHISSWGSLFFSFHVSRWGHWFVTGGGGGGSYWCGRSNLNRQVGRRKKSVYAHQLTHTSNERRRFMIHFGGRFESSDCGVFV
jgi:hypothetical protein